jgi:hypothetical protein
MQSFVRLLPAVLVAATGLGVSTASANLINFTSNGTLSSEHLGAYTGTALYTPSGNNAATLVLTITNATAPATGGYITAVALAHGDNFAGITVAMTSTSDADFGNLAALVSAPPFGSYRGGASTSSSWTGGGNPSVGTGVNQTLTLTFSLSGTGAGLRSAGDFVGLHSNHQDLVVRFRGMNNDGSDKVPGILVPTPGTASLLAIGCLAASRRRRP